MPILKIGSEGDIVKVWQVIVGTTVNGIFSRKE